MSPYPDISPRVFRLVMAPLVLAIVATAIGMCDAWQRSAAMARPRICKYGVYKIEQKAAR